MSDCPLCQPAAPADIIWCDDRLRVIRVHDNDFPGYTRVIWHGHVAEMTELSRPARQAFMEVVWQVEAVMRSHLRPDKVNLAQLGNMVPHLHWHIVPRWQLDNRFPDAIWAAPRTRTPEQLAAWSRLCEARQQQLPAYWAALRDALNGMAD